MSAPLVKSLNLELKGAAPLRRIAGYIVLGAELSHKKRALGYEGEGSHHAFRRENETGKRLPWTDYCKTQAGVTETMARHYFQCGEAVRLRLRFSSKPEAKALLEKMELPPSELTPEQRLSLIQKIEEIGLKRGDTQVYLRKEYRTAQLPQEVLQDLSAMPSPVAEKEELYQKAVRLEPLVDEENQRRRRLLTTAVLARRAGVSEVTISKMKLVSLARKTLAALKS
jgi:hypothetical protein